MSSNQPRLSVVIPAHNEESCLDATVRELTLFLSAAGVNHEVVVVNDGSTDETSSVLNRLEAEFPSVRGVKNHAPNGFGFAIRKGFSQVRGEAVAIYMADASDRPKDLLRFFQVWEKGEVDCVFGTRFASESRVVDYPKFKLALNRLANTFIRLVFGIRYNDVTNAFKLYSRRTLEGLKPYLSNHFNLTVELPLKAIVRGYTYEVVPNEWWNRKTGESKLRVKEMGARYLFIILYCLIEKWLSRGDYRRTDKAPQSLPATRLIEA